MGNTVQISYWNGGKTEGEGKAWTTLVYHKVMFSVNDVPYAKKELETEITAGVERIITEIVAVFL